ncbi:MAG: LacI family DNA-binding transcriptional regulator [Spirochaetota bacterium]
MKITIKDIAKISGVSKSTVSRVINKSGPVSKKTREMVANAIKILNYKPNEVARSLVLKRSQTLCLIVQDIRNPYYAHACWYSERVFRKYGYTTIICTADSDPKLEKEFLDAMKYRNVDGILCIGGKEDATNIINFKSRENLPIVLVDREVKGYNISTVTLDNVYGGQLAVNYLYNLGHSNIAFVTSDYTTAERNRMEGYRLAFRKKNMEPPEHFIISQSEEMWLRGICPQLLDLVKKKSRPTAIFASNDFKALQVLRLLRKENISVPDEISIVGYDDIEVASIVHPALSTVHQPLDKMIEIGASMLLKVIEDRSVSEQKVLKPWLFERESTRKIGDPI